MALLQSKKTNQRLKKKCILAEEIGHYLTSDGNILDQGNVENIKQEDKARGWAYFRVLDPVGFVFAYKAGCRSRHEIAEYLDVTEEFLQEAIGYFKRKHGLFYRINKNYLITFEPLGVLEMFD